MPAPLRPAPGTPTGRLVAEFGTWLTVRDVAALLKVSPMTVYRLVDASDLDAIRVGRSIRIPERGVRHYLGAGGSEQELYPPDTQQLRAVGGQ